MADIKTLLRKMFPERLWAFCCRVYYNCVLTFARLRYAIAGKKVDDPKRIPVIINNYNRVSDLKRLIASLESRGYDNIVILDNNSTYPPLLAYYETCPHEVIRLPKNYGFLAIWQSGVYERFKSSFYVYTDSDLEIVEDCPDDFMAKFLGIFHRHPFCHKVGFGLCIDDLPDHYAHKAAVLRNEAEFWENEVEPGVFDAVSDTTFALYRPFTKGASSPYKFMCRTGAPYMMRHLPWYLDLDNLDEEERYYSDHVIQSTHWSKTAKNNNA